MRPVRYSDGFKQDFRRVERRGYDSRDALLFEDIALALRGERLGKS
jgi:hypothetical protein